MDCLRVRLLFSIIKKSEKNSDLKKLRRFIDARHPQLHKNVVAPLVGAMGVGKPNM